MLTDEEISKIKTNYPNLMEHVKKHQSRAKPVQATIIRLPALFEIRITIPRHYLDPNCAGYRKLQERKGHYVGGDSIAQAVAKAFVEFPDEVLDIQKWKDYRQQVNPDYLGRFKLQAKKIVQVKSDGTIAEASRLLS